MTLIQNPEGADTTSGTPAALRIHRPETRPPMPPSAAGGGCPFQLKGSVPGRSNGVEGRTLQHYGPAPLVELPGGVQARVIVAYDLAQRLTAGSDVSRNADHWPGFRDGSLAVDGVLRQWAGPRNALNAEGEEHARLRAPIQAGLTPRRVREMTPVIEAIVEEALEDLEGIADASGVVDLVPAFALRIPQQVITRLMGVPSALMEQFGQAATGLFDTSAGPADMQHSMDTVLELLGEMVAARRAHLGDDLVSDLIRAAEQTDNPLSDEDLLAQLMLVVIAATETTVHAIGTLIVHLLTHPAQRALIVSGEVSLDDALEESLRLQPPAASVPLRFAVRDFEDAESGQVFRKGEPILIHAAAAGTDPDVHTTPGAYNVRRPTRRKHLAFGHGPHVCPGAPLARREVVIAVSRWLERFPDARLAVDAARLPQPHSFIANGFTEIPVLLG
ncbi:cytochrome P450 [Streptomyces canus]|uniref:cytochrome P450 n=1 Tax=Streptomyces canus TaxID=58343 RepID=UPI0033B5EB6E